MRIALFVHCFYPAHFYGTEAYTLALAKQLCAFGHTPHVVTAIFPGEPPQQSLVETREWEGIPVYSIDKNVFPNRSIKDTYEQPDLRFVHERILRRIAPDVVHVCHLINHTTSVIEVASAMQIPIYMTLTDFFGFCLNNKLETAEGSLCAGPSRTRANCIACQIKAIAATAQAPAMIRKIAAPPVRTLAAHGLALRGGRAFRLPHPSFQPADIVERPERLRRAMSVVRAAVAPSAFLRDAYLANGFPAPLTLNHFGVEIDRSAKPPPPSNAVRLGYIGQIAPHKGVHVLIEALRAADAPSLSLDIWGPDNQDTGYYAELRGRSAGLNIRFRGVFSPARTAGILAEMDVLAIPSTWYENSPLILLQALATHTPVLVSDVLGLTEFVAEGKMGFRFPRGDAAALAKILRLLSEDVELLRRLSQTTEYLRTPAEMARSVEQMFIKGRAAAAPPPHVSAAEGVAT
jgi:glycosyltransferase involved in cell wall biosynthesis